LFVLFQFVLFAAGIPVTFWVATIHRFWTMCWRPRKVGD